MSKLKERLARKINNTTDFNWKEVTADDIHPQPSKKILDIPRWFLWGNICCSHTISECVKTKHTLVYDDYLQEFFIKELDY